MAYIEEQAINPHFNVYNSSIFLRVLPNAVDEELVVTFHSWLQLPQESLTE